MGKAVGQDGRRLLGSAASLPICRDLPVTYQSQEPRPEQIIDTEHVLKGHHRTTLFQGRVKCNMKAKDMLPLPFRKESAAVSLDLLAHSHSLALPPPPPPPLGRVDLARTNSMLFMYSLKSGLAQGLF